MKILRIIFFALPLTFIFNSHAVAIIVNPVDDATLWDGLQFSKDGVADFMNRGSSVQILDVDRPVQPFENRGIFEFDITNLVHADSAITLNMPVNSSLGPYPFTLDLYTYAGDGIVSLGDFNAGSLHSSFDYSGESLITFDVTTFITDLLTTPATYAGFNLQFSVPSIIPLNGPYVTIGSEMALFPPFGTPASLVSIPSPGTLSLFIIGLLSLIYIRRRKTN